MPKSSFAAKVAGVLATTAAIPALCVATAHADTPGTVYFAASGMNCSIADDGTVGCDSPTARPMQITIAGIDLPVPFSVNQVVIDVPWAPAHPAFGGTPHTLPGGNPPISTIGHPVGSGATGGSGVDHGGASCATGFHGSFSCTSKGHSFSYYEMFQGN